MATVDGYTAQRMKAIEDATVVDGDIVDGNLILKRFDGVEIDAGSVGGVPGPAGPTSITLVANQAARLALASPTNGMVVLELDTGRQWERIAGTWQWIIGTGTSPYLVQAAPEASQTFAANTAATVVLVDSVDRASAFASNVFTVPVPGVWRIHGVYRLTPTSAAPWNPVVNLQKAAVDYAQLDAKYFTSLNSGMTMMHLGYEGPFALGDQLRFSITSGQIGCGNAWTHQFSRVSIDLCSY